MSKFTRTVSMLALFVALAALALTAAPPTSAQTAIPYTGYLATYYNGRDLQGTPILQRLEPVVNWTYDTGGSPAPGVVPTTDFSTRWEGWYNMDRPGVWTYTMTSDDGARVYLDNELIIDMWFDHAPLTRARTRQVSPGYHLIRVEYYQHLGGMTAQLTILPPGVFPDWRGEYYDNPFLLGEPKVVVNNVDINFNWGTAGPNNRVPPDNFSVRWTRFYTFAPGNYTFTATADDGIRAWVGDTLIIDGWHPQQAQTYTATVYLDGSVPMRVEYFEATGQAVVMFSWRAASGSPPPPPGNVWQGTYFNNPNLVPPPVCDQPTNQINFNWGGNGPGCGIPGQYFSVRWDSIQNAPAAGFYTVNLLVDDGARIFVDGNLILNCWRERPPTQYSTTVYLNPGPHNWRVEYFQASGGAQISVNIVAGVTPPPTPPPPPSGDVIVAALGPGWTQGGKPDAWRQAPDGIGGTALWTYNNAYVQPDSNWGRWYPQLPQARNYEVFVYIPPGVATTNSARYSIAHAGKYDSVTCSQAQSGGQWVSLGTYYFSAQGGEFVTLSDVTYEPYLSTTVVWDQVKFAPR